jgi:hypothetical protein
MSKKLLQTRNAMRINKNMVSKQNIRDKEHIIVKGAVHMLLNTTMNGIFYPADEVKKLADNIGSDRVTMPSSHPTGENGEFISASDPWALTSNYVGAYAYNFSVQGDKLISDVAIDPVIANTSESGRAIINAIENSEPIDVSTGFYLNVDEKSGYGSDGEPYEMVASNLTIDHSAFLPNDAGAKNKLEGVGLHTNSARLKDETIDTYVADIQVNASAPAMKLPLANNDYVFNADQALERVKNYTNSTDKPSTSYRKFFLNFDQDNADSFDSYTNLFADIIDNVPHAIKSQVANMDSEHAKAYVDRFDSQMKGNKQSFVKKVLNKIFGKKASNELSHDETRDKIHDKLNEGRGNDLHYHYLHDIFSTYFVYCGDNDKLYKQAYAMVDDNVAFIGEKVEVEREVEYKPITNTTESVMDKAELIALLTANGITANADMTDDELKAKLKKKLEGKGKDEKLDEVANAATANAIATLTATVNALQTSITANADKELTQARESVIAANKGIDEEMASTMTLSHCNKFLASHGHVAVNARPNYTQTNADESCASLKLEA